jgi:antitoxin YefM
MNMTDEEQRAIEETLFLTSIPGMGESIIVGLETPVDECSEEPGGLLSQPW